MVADDGKVKALAALETANDSGDGSQKGSSKKKDGKESATPAAEPEIAKWLEREWLQRWSQIQPRLGETDLRPYVFVARDKRMLAGTAELGGLEGLIEKLTGPEMAVRMVEPDVKALAPADAEQVFTGLREKVLSHGSFNAAPPGFGGMSIVAKHHPRFQQELVGMLAGIDVNTLGVWVVTGWNEILTEQVAKDDLQTLLTQWMNQDESQLLKKAAGTALSGRRKGTG
jgi:hypothetical protein